MLKTMAKFDYLQGIRFFAGVVTLLWTNPSFAQIKPDNTLPNNSQIQSVNNTLNIGGGTQVGKNLFHSFQEFSVPSGNTAYFNNDLNIQNIISRVTGKSISNIDSLIKANGTANLFLINPNGIIFNQNARLDIGGSFFASTANSIKFADGFEFSAIAPQSTPLLTINTPIGLQFGANPGIIQVNGVIQTKPNQTLALVGNNVSLDGGQLLAPGGRVELGGVAGTGGVELTNDSNNPRLSFPEGLPRANVSLSNQAKVNVSANGGGSIAVNAMNLNMSGGSQLIAGISDSGLPNTQAGDIEINGTGKVEIAGSSNISNDVLQGAVGNAGKVNISAKSLAVTDGSYLASSTHGHGNAGNLSINTLQIDVTNSYLAASANGQVSQANAGNITINAGDTVSFDGSGAYTDITQEINQGKAGNLNINAESLAVKNQSYLFSSSKGAGNAGNVMINVGTLSVSNKSILAASANGQVSQANAGNITIKARDTVSFDQSNAYTNVTENVNQGNAGNLSITAKSLSVLNNSIIDGTNQGQGRGGNFDFNTLQFDVTNGSYLDTNTHGQGNASNITINTDKLNVTDNSFLAASASGQGNAGKIIINARDVLFANNSQAYTDFTGKGNGDDIKITTDKLEVNNNSFLAASTKGEGNSGSIYIQARGLITFDGGFAYTDVSEKGKGNAGEINITADQLNITNGAKFEANTKSQGDAGNITINTNKLDVTNNSFLAASANGQGNAGKITLKAREILFGNGSQAYTDVTQKGNGGNLTITADKLDVINHSSFSASTNGEGNAGNITINADKLNLTNSAKFEASTKYRGDAGNITINTNKLDVLNDSFFAASANGQGNAGKITINSGDVSFNNGSLAYTDVTEKGNGGEIKINTGSLSITNGSQLVANTQNQGNAGKIDINTGSLTVTNNSFLTASGNGEGNAGNITIQAREPVIFSQGSAFTNVGNNSFCNVVGSSCNKVAEGTGGNITIVAPSLKLINCSFLATGIGDNLTQSKVQGSAGSILLNLTDHLLLDQSYITSRVFANGVGKAGNIDINAGSVEAHQSLISASTQGRGDAGNVSIKATNLVSLDNSDISTAVQQGAIGNAQGIKIMARSLALTNGAQLNAVTSGEGKAGDIFINTTDNVSISGTNTKPTPTNLFSQNIPYRFTSPPDFYDGVSSGIFTSTNSSGIGGDITVNANSLNIANGALIDARTTASARGGLVTVNTNTFEATSGGQLTATASANGSAGNIILKTGVANISGSDRTYQERVAQFGNQTDIYGKLKVGNQGATSGLIVSSTGSGSAGNLNVEADSIRLDNGAKINADTDTTGGGGNISLNSPLMILRHGSSITTNARGRNITGGNITIDAKNGFIVAFPNENSDIRADSEEFRGGNVTIKNAAQIFGIQGRKEPSLQTNDITAKGATPDLSGTVQINNFEVDPSRGLVPLPIAFVDISRLVDENICTRTATSSFTNTGRGGLPASPHNTLNSDAMWEDWRLTAVPREANNTAMKRTSLPTVSASVSKPIVEANGWMFDQNGNVTLVANSSTPNFQSPVYAPTSCHTR